MANFTRHRVNPYLFILLKRMVGYEVRGIGVRPTNLQVAEFVYARWKGEKFRHTNYNSSKGKRDPVAYRLAQSIRRDLLTPESFEFSEKKLNQLAAEVSIIDQFSSWNDFVNKYQNDKGAILAERNFMLRPFYELNEDEQETLYAWADYRLLKLHFEYIRNDKRNDHQIIKSTNDFVIRTINPSETKEIVAKLNNLYPHSHDSVDRLRNLFEKNRNVFYIFKDDYNMLGFVSVLPITEQAYTQLTARKFKIEANSIHSLEEKDSVKYIYIENGFYALKRVLRVLVLELKVMISKVSDLNKICIICSKTENDLIDEFCRANSIEVCGINKPHLDEPYEKFQDPWDLNKKALFRKIDWQNKEITYLDEP